MEENKNEIVPVKQSILRNVKKKKKDKKSVWWIMIGIGCLIILFLIILSSVLNVGERLRKINVYVEIGFYVLAFLLV